MNWKFRHRLILTMLSLYLVGSYGASAFGIEARLMRYPDVSADQIVFTYDGDLWLVAVTGGAARRLTTAEGEEKYARFSPDGSQIAYSVDRDGNTDVYVISAAGGVATRVTHHPDPDLIRDWYPDGKHLLIASPMASERARYNQLYRVPATGGFPEKLPLAYGESAAISPDGSAIAYTTKRDFQEYEAWKRYLGGRAPDIWHYAFSDGKSTKLTTHPAPDSSPMWAGDDLYFLSERGSQARSNIWALNPDSGAVEQVTHYLDFDVRHPAVGPSHIIFQNGGRLHLMDLRTHDVQQLEITVATQSNELEPRTVSVGDKIASLDLSGDASSVLFEARGDVFLMDSVLGITTNLTRSPDIAERWPSLSPDGHTVVYMGDANGEYQLTLLDLETSATRVLTEFESGFRYRPQWSPDGNWIIFADQNQILHLTNVKNGRILEIDKGLWRSHYELVAFRVSWSADSRYIAWSRGLDNRNQAIFIYDVKAKTRHQVTRGYYSDFDPVFDPDGRFLYLQSHRNMEPHYGDIDATWTYTNSTTISAVPLHNDGLSPFHPDFSVTRDSDTDGVDIEGFESRLVTLPIEPGRISDLQAASGKILYRRMPRMGGSGRLPSPAFSEPDRKSPGARLFVYNFENKSETAVTSADFAQVSSDGTKILVRQKDRYGLVAPVAEATLKKPLPVERLTVMLDRQAEYTQMFREAWRYQRDFYYDPGQHGVDWDAVGARYGDLVPHARNDDDMTFILHELVSELGGGHTWAWASPDRRRRGRAEGAGPGLLGVDFDIQNGVYQFARILDAGPRDSEYRSPLKDPGIDVREGDTLVAVNGVPLDERNDPWAAFDGLAEKPVRLSILRPDDRNGKRDIVVKALKDDHKLRELAWVAQNARKVTELSDGRIGYIYVPDTGQNGQNELMRQYRAQFNKPALLIDERFNSGGALGDRLVELLNRPALVYFRFRNARDYPLPELAHNGPKALLINGWSYSGGDGFPHLFRAAGLGPLVGTRTWGGLIGPNLPLPLLNGGFVSAPPQRVVDRDGLWAEDNDGTKPDIEIENDPAALFLGEDKELEAAVAAILGMLGKDATPTMPPYPSEPQRPDNN